ncbi:hypothetical protein PRIPAC_77171, partial [Pristionchus pacificus]|uniref:Dehydrogenase n=1 Tax=Pristionchus pacificus TaxID=54126 RepID=A0A2A6C4G5_PRIPA
NPPPFACFHSLPLDCSRHCHYLFQKVPTVMGFFSGGQFKENVSAVGKVVAVTGCNTGIGLETAKELNLRGAKVYMLCRTEERAEAAKAEMVQAGCDGSRLIFLKCDLASFESVRKCAQRLGELESHLDVLVNNAGMVLGEFSKTEDGHESTWHANHLGPMLLTELLLPLIEKSAEGRVVLVASELHKRSPKLDINKVDSQEGYKGPMEAYNKSKLGNVMYARELARRLKERGSTVTVNSLHPGVIKTELGRHFGVAVKVFHVVGGVFMKTRKEGAQTSIYLALSTEVKGVSGGYFSDCARATESANAKDDAACKELYDYSLKTIVACLAEDSCYSKLCSLMPFTLSRSFQIIMPSCGGQFRENVSAVGKVMAVTGCNTGIGLETAKELNLRGAKIYMLCRSEERAKAARKEMIESGCEASRLIFLACNLSSFDGIRKCAAKLSECPVLLTQLLLPLIAKSDEGRIVMVSSDAHSLSPKLNLSTVDTEAGFHGGIEAYNKSKLANVTKSKKKHSKKEEVQIMYTKELARRLKEKESSITVNCLHPGIFRKSSTLGVFMKSRKDGAQTTLFLALSTEDCKRANESSLANDEAAAKELDYTLKTVRLN